MKRKTIKYYIQFKSFLGWTASKPHASEAETMRLGKPYSSYLKAVEGCIELRQSKFYKDDKLRIIEVTEEIRVV